MYALRHDPPPAPELRQGHILPEPRLDFVNTRLHLVLVYDGALPACPRTDARTHGAFLPKWFPGGTYKQFAIDAKKFINSSLDELYTTALDGLVSPLERLRSLRGGR